MSGFIIAQFPSGNKGSFFGTPSPLHLGNHTAAGYGQQEPAHGGRADIRDSHYARTAYTIERELGVPVVEEIWESVFKNRPFFKELSIDKSVSGL